MKKITLRCLAIVAVKRWTYALEGYFAKHVLPAGAVYLVGF